MAFSTHTGNNMAVGASPDGNYVAVCATVSPYLFLYKRNGRAFDRISISTPPVSSSASFNVAWHPSSTYFAVSSYNGPRIYKIVDDTVSLVTFSDMSDRAIGSLAWSHDGTILAIGDALSSVLPIRIYIFDDSDDSFTEATDIDVLPQRYVSGLDFSPDDGYLVVASSYLGTSGIAVYKITGGAYFTKLTSGIPQRCYAAKFSNDGLHMAVGCASSSGSASLYIYKRSGDTFSLLSSWLTSGSIFSLAYSANSLLVASSDTSAVRLLTISGDTYALGTSSSAMGGACRSLSLSGDMRFLISITGATGYSIPYVWFGAYPVGQLPSGGLISQDEDNTFTWSIGNDYPELFSSTQIAAKFRYQESSAETYTEIDIEDGTQSYTVAASTFTAASVDWQVQIESEDEFWTDETAWFTLDTGEDSLSTAVCVSPVNKAVNGAIDNTFSWTHIIDTGTEPTGADLQYMIPEGEWTTLATVTGSDTHTVIAAGTLPSGTVYWRVRTYNANSEAGEWSGAAYIAVRAAPSAPSISSISNAARPVVRWQSSSQVSYELNVLSGINTIYSTGEIPGTVKVHGVTDYLDDGSYTVQLRIKNEYSLWSGWTTGGVTISTTKPDAPTITATAITNGVRITVDVSADITTMYLLRNDIPIAKITGTYDDYAAVGTNTYVVRGVDVGDNFADSEEAEAETVINHAVIAAVDDLEEMVSLIVRRGDYPTSPRSKTYISASNNYAGRTYPVITFSEFLSESYSPIYAFSSATDFDALNELADRRQAILYRDARGDSYYGAIVGLPSERDRLGYTFTLNITRVDYVEEIDYDAPGVT